MRQVVFDDDAGFADRLQAALAIPLEAPLEQLTDRRWRGSRQSAPVDVGTEYVRQGV